MDPRPSGDNGGCSGRQSDRSGGDEDPFLVSDPTAHGGLTALLGRAGPWLGDGHWPGAAGGSSPGGGLWTGAVRGGPWPGAVGRGPPGGGAWPGVVGHGGPWFGAATPGPPPGVAAAPPLGAATAAPPASQQSSSTPLNQIKTINIETY